MPRIPSEYHVHSTDTSDVTVEVDHKADGRIAYDITVREGMLERTLTDLTPQEARGILLGIANVLR